MRGPSAASTTGGSSRSFGTMPGAAANASRASEANLTATVAAARANGRSWARIAAVLGVSKQAAMRRFSDPRLLRKVG
jgi:hypothetical protein